MKKIIALALMFVMLFTVAVATTSCKKDDGEPKVKLIDVALTEEEYAYVLKKGNEDLKNDMDAFLTEIKDNGEFQKIVDKYFKGEGEKVGQAVATSSVTNDENTFVVATNCPFEPFEYIGDDGKIYGVDIEIAAAYAQSRGLNLVIKNIDFDAIFTEVNAGYADVGMAGITVSEDRLKTYDFTQTYYNASQKLIVAADDTTFDACETVDDVEAILASLQGKKAGYQIGTTGGMYVDGNEDWGYPGFANLEGKGYSTALDATRDLVNGNIYVVVVDEAPGAAIVNAINNN